MRNIAIWVFIFTALLFSDVFSAENPLRAQTYQTSANPNYPDTSAIARLSQNQTGQSLVRQDRDVVQVGFNNPAANRPAAALNGVGVPRGSGLTGQHNPAPQRSVGFPESAEPLQHRQNFLERQRASETVAPTSNSRSTENSFGQLISRIGMNLAFVLMLAIGGVLVAKQWVKSKSGVTPGGDDNSVPVDSMQIKAVLKLDTKSTLRLIRCGSTQVLVATDSLGIKSVNVINPSFDQTMLGAANDATSTVQENPADGSNYSVHSEKIVQSNDAGQATTRSRKPKIYQSPGAIASNASNKKRSEAKETDSVVDQRLIRMLLENSKKRTA